MQLPPPEAFYEQEYHSYTVACRAALGHYPSLENFCELISDKTPILQGAAKGGRQKEFDHSFFPFSGLFRSLFGHFFLMFLSLFFVIFCKTPLPDSFCGSVRYCSCITKSYAHFLESCSLQLPTRKSPRKKVGHVQLYKQNVSPEAEVRDCISELLWELLTLTAWICGGMVSPCQVNMELIYRFKAMFSDSQNCHFLPQFDSNKSPKCTATFWMAVNCFLFPSVPFLSPFSAFFIVSFFLCLYTVIFEIITFLIQKHFKTVTVTVISGKLIQMTF